MGISTQKMVFSSLAIAFLIGGATPAIAVDTPTSSSSQRLVTFVSCSSITMRTEPNPYAPAIMTQSNGANEVMTIPNESFTTSGVYRYLEEDYTQSGNGSYSDILSGYGAYEDSNGNIYQTNATTVYNYTSSPDNYWCYSNLTDDNDGSSLASGARTYGAGDVWADNTNPTAWLVEENNGRASDLRLINGWYVDGQN